jgi:hypothetical protein
MSSVLIPENCNCLTIVGRKVIEGIGVGGPISVATEKPSMRGKRIIHGRPCGWQSVGDQPTRITFGRESGAGQERRSVWLYLPRIKQRGKLFELTELTPVSMLGAGKWAMDNPPHAAAQVQKEVPFPALEMGRQLILLRRAADGYRLHFCDRRIVIGKMSAAMHTAAERCLVALTADEVQ